MGGREVVLLVFALVVFSFSVQCVQGTPLDDYVNAPDPVYSWTVNGSFRSWFGYTAYNIYLTSQTWLTPKQSSRPLWTHWLTICVPDFIDPTVSQNAFMYIDGGHTTDSAPTQVDLVTEVLCVSSRTISAALLQIPNEPLYFDGDGIRRSEDALIAYGWAKFLNDSAHDPIWLARLPMTKAAVKAMDTIQAFALTLPGGPVTIKNFVVAGASKRGWTTWTTGAVDKRVIGIIPMVMPILNIVPNMNHHYQAYGGWSFALDDYLDQGIMAYLNMPEFLKMAAINDPWSYRDRLTMPKLILCAAGDEFFLPDSPQFFMDGLPGEKYLTVIPDAEHSLITAYPDVGETMSTFYQLVIKKHARPVYSYKLNKSNTTASIEVTVDVNHPPAYVTLWYATTLSSTLRDFRLVTCYQLPACLQPVIWWYTELAESRPGVYIARMNAPPAGWTGFLVELSYEYRDLGGAEKRLLRVSTEVNIVPDVMPFPPCGRKCQ